MRPSLLVLALVLIAASPVRAEFKGAAWCRGAAMSLDLPDDEAVFAASLLIEEQIALRTWGNSSKKYLELIQERAWSGGVGAGQAHCVRTAKGNAFAAKLFMGCCWDNDHAVRAKILPIYAKP